MGVGIGMIRAFAAGGFQHGTRCVGRAPALEDAGGGRPGEEEQGEGGEGEGFFSGGYARFAPFRIRDAAVRTGLTSECPMSNRECPMTK